MWSQILNDYLFTFYKMLKEICLFNPRPFITTFFFYRIVYDISRCFVQFVLPLGVVLCMYVSIFCKLKERPLSQHSENNQRRRRTNIMLISVSIIFFLSWLPLNTLNFLLDFNSDIINVSQIHTNGSNLNTKKIFEMFLFLF